MDAWQWPLVVLAALSALFVMASIVWGIFDVLRDDRLNQTATALWVLLLFVVPLPGILAWLWFRTRLGPQFDGFNLKKTL